MGPAQRPQITFTGAVRASGNTERQLRHWVDNAQVTLQGDSEREQGQWRRFSLVDVVRLAIIGTLVRYGIPVSVADEVVIMAVDPRLSAFASHVVVPRRAVQVALRGGVLIVSPGAATEQVLPANDIGIGTLLCRAGFDPAKKPSPDPNGFKPDPLPKTDDLRHFIQIDLGGIVGDVLARLDEADSD